MKNGYDIRLVCQLATDSFIIRIEDSRASSSHNSKKETITCSGIPSPFLYVLLLELFTSFVDHLSKQ